MRKQPSSLPIVILFQELPTLFLYKHPLSIIWKQLPQQILRTDNRQMVELMKTFPNILYLILKATAFVLKGLLQRQAELQCFSAEEKFRQLLTRTPQVLNLIPHKYLASYLGIDPATFSKLLGSVR